jgi:uncharacterized membrane protein
MPGLLPYLFWIHLVGMSIWVGASFLMPLVIIPAMQSVDGPARAQAIGAISKKLAPFIWVSIILVFLSGIEQTRRIYGFEHLLSINVLTVKIFVAVLMMANGAYLGGVLSQKVAQLAPAPGTPPSAEFIKKQRSLVRHSWIQAALAVIILLIVGFLTA